MTADAMTAYEDAIADHDRAVLAAEQALDLEADSLERLGEFTDAEPCEWSIALERHAVVAKRSNQAQAEMHRASLDCDRARVQAEQQLAENHRQHLGQLRATAAN